MDWEFSGEIWQWRGPAPYYFVTVPEEESSDLQAMASALTYGWGMLPVQVQIGNTEWTTSLWPKDGGYVLPLKDAVRRAEDLGEGQTIDVRLATKGDPPPVGRDDREVASVRSPSRPRRAEAGQSGEAPTVAVPRRAREQISEDQLTIVPANEATWADLQAVFGARGDSSRCWCQRYKMHRGETWAGTGPEELASRLRDQTACDDPAATATTGLVAYLDGEPVGWCAVDPRSANPRLLSHSPVPWVGRTEDKRDDSVWAVTCFVVRAGFRRRGISGALARAAVEFARQGGARALEGYPSFAEFTHVGTPGAFADAGLVEVSRPTKSRAVMRIDF